MTLVEKALALRQVSPFSQLRPEELLVVADAATPRALPPGRVLVRRDGNFRHLWVRLAGDLVDDTGAAAPPLAGATALFTGEAAPQTLQAGSQGYQGLALPQGAFLTIVHECPVLLAGLLQLPPEARAAGPARPRGS